MTVTAKGYAALINVSPSLVTKKLNVMETKALPGVAKIDRYGNTWMFTLKKNFNATTVKEQFKKLTTKSLVNSN